MQDRLAPDNPEIFPDSSLKKVLFISNVPTHPTNAGNRARILAMAGLLTQVGWQVHFALISTNESFEVPMRQYWGDQLFYLAPPGPDTRLISRVLRRVKGWLKVDRITRRLLYEGRHGVDEGFTPAIGQFIRELAGRTHYDAVVAEYATLSKALTFFGPVTRKFIDTHDVFTNRDQKFASHNPSGRYIFALSAREEAKGLRRADVVIAIQEHEKRFFQTIYPGKVVVMGHSVEIKPPVTPCRGGRTLLFIGSRHDANVIAVHYFIRDILPLIRKTMPGVAVLIAGRVCERLDAAGGCTRLGEVQDLDGLYEQTDVVINPVTVGTGLKIKNLEALGRGKPLVTTPVGAEGMEAGIGRAFLVSDTSDTFAAQVVELLRDERKAAAFSEEALRFALSYNGRVMQEFLSQFSV